MARLCLADGSEATLEHMEIDNQKAGETNQQRSYCELEVPKDANVGILMQSEGHGDIYYDGATGDVLDTNKKTVASYTPLSPGSTVGINVWSVKEDSHIKTFLSLTNDGLANNVIPFSLQGTLKSPSIYIDNEDSKVVVNVDKESFKHNPGNV